MSYYNLISLMPKTPAVDPDAQAFITAASITDPTQQSAINQLVVDLKGYSIWSKMKAIYPFVGGTASTHKWNLKDPRDLDASFRLQFINGWTHSNTGAKGNGSDAYANTFFAPNPQLNVYNTSCSYYSRINVNEGNKPALGAGTGYTPLTAFAIYSTGSYYGSPDYGASQVGFSDINSLGFYSGTRTAINNAKIYKNGVLRATNTTNPTSLNLTTTKLVLNAFSASGFIESFSAKECAFASIGDGLTDTEAANFYTAVQAFQVALSRNI
jgi:hypothetical protein